MITSFLTHSDVRREILALLFSNPDRRYYQRQLEKLLGRPVAAVRREVLRLEREGLFLRSTEGNLVFFQVNTSHPLFDEVRSIVAKTIGIPSELRHTLGKVEGVRLAMIYGSYSRYVAREPGIEWTGESDIDLMVIGTVDMGELSHRLQKIEKRFRRQINPTIYKPQELLEKLRSGHDFLKDVLSHFVIPLIGFGDSAILQPIRMTASKLQEKLGGSKGD